MPCFTSAFALGDSVRPKTAPELLCQVERVVFSLNMGCAIYSLSYWHDGRQQHIELDETEISPADA